MPSKSHFTLLFYCFVFRCAHLTGKNRCNCQNYTVLSNAEIHKRSSLYSNMIPTSLLLYIFCNSLKIFTEMKMIWNSVFHLQVPRKEGQHFFCCHDSRHHLTLWKSRLAISSACKEPTLSYHNFPFVGQQDILLAISESGNVALVSLAEQLREGSDNACLLMGCIQTVSVTTIFD